MEFNNVAEVPAYRGRMLEYAQKLLSWRMNHEDRALPQRTPHRRWPGHPSGSAPMTFLGNIFSSPPIGSAVSAKCMPVVPTYTGVPRRTRRLLLVGSR